MRTTPAEHLDVLIVGAGLSGIGAGCHLRRRRPATRFAILESRQAIGGTWDLFRYPGVRADSDMYTLGYAFAPWTGARTIADGPSVLRYVTDTADRHGVTERVRFGHTVLGADWSSTDCRWTVRVRRAEGDAIDVTCSFLLSCGGYYDYAAGFMPAFPDAERFAGPIVHPQHWPPDLDYTGRRVVVIGSGATAVTLVPAMAPTAGHVTMLQRSPSYVISLPGHDPLAALARRWLPEMAAYQLIRAKNVALQSLTYRLSRRFPRRMRALIRRAALAQLPAGFDVDTHFAPRYDPWDERLCVSPDGDLFAALRAGTASIVTDRIVGFTEQGIALAGGGELAADVIVAATGLRLAPLGGLVLTVDGQPVDVSRQLVYKGSMLSEVPNLAFVIGYANASWTLKADLTCEYVCRLLAHMEAHGYRECRPPAPAPSVTREPLINLRSGYVQRAQADLPGQGSKRPWRLRQNYPLDRLELTRRPVADGVIEFSTGAAAAAPRRSPVPV